MERFVVSERAIRPLVVNVHVVIRHYRTICCENTDDAFKKRTVIIVHRCDIFIKEMVQIKCSLIPRI